MAIILVNTDRDTDRIHKRNNGLSYARDIPYYTLQEMKQSVENAHKLFQRELDMFDTMYYLKLISYGELQRSYKSQHVILDTR